MLNTMMENKNTSFANILIPFRSKACVFIFHHSVQHDEASGYTFYNEVDCPN